MTYRAYKDIVLDCLKRKRYPVLYDHILLVIEYKWILPLRTTARVVENSRFHSSEIIYEKLNKPFQLLFLASGAENNGTTLYAYECNDFDPHKDCSDAVLSKVVRFGRKDLGDLLKTEFKTFEEEIYVLITYLNTDVAKIRGLLDLKFDESTRFVPFSFRLCACKFFERGLETACMFSGRECFGPSVDEDSDRDVLDTREVYGKISACASKEEILSLNDDVNWKRRERYQQPVQFNQYNSYNMHYSVPLKTVFPLAYNPLENPIIAV